MFKKCFIAVIAFLLLLSTQFKFVIANDVNLDIVDSSVEERTLTSIIVDKKEMIVDDTQDVIVTFNQENLLEDQYFIYYVNLETKEEYIQESTSVEKFSVRFSFKLPKEGTYQINKIEVTNTKLTNTFDLSKFDTKVFFGVGKTVVTSPDFIMSDDSIFEFQSLKVNDVLPKPMLASINKNLVVVLDPGHGGGDPGAVRTYNGVMYKESELNLKIANACEKELKTYSNVDVYMTRRDEVSPFMDRSQRIDFAKKLSADVIVSIHLNASTNTNATGAEVYIPNLNYRPDLSAESKALANNILGVLISDGMVNRGTTFNTASNTYYPDGSLADSLGINYYSKLAGFPGILIEHCFLSNSADFINYLSTDDKLKKLGISDATGIAKHYMLSKLKIYPEECSVFLGSNKQLAVSLGGSIISNDSVTWKSSDLSIASVDNAGKITPIKVGSCIVSCTTTNGLSSSCVVNVRNRLEMNTSYYSFYQGQKSGFAVTLDGKKIENSVMKWSSSNENIVKVDSTGIITGNGVGQAEICAKDEKNNLITKCIVDVLKIKQVSLNTSEFSLYYNTKSTFAAFVDGSKVENSQMQWSSSNEEVVKVDANGTIYGLKGGTAVVNCTTPNGTVATCQITVLSVLKINTSSYAFYVSDKSNFAVTLDGIKIDNSVVNWSSSDSNIVKVENGIIYGINQGKAIISARNKSNDLVSECQVNVLQKSVVTLNTNKFEMYSGTKSGFAAFINGIKVDNSKMQWSSSDEKIVKVDANGTIYGLKGGTAVVSCTTSNGTVATCQITVLSVLKINTSNYGFFVGDKSNFAVTLDGVKIDNSLLNWSSSDSNIVKVENGIIYGISPGKVIISVKNSSNDLVSECRVSVLQKNVVTMNTTNFEMYPSTKSGFAAFVDANKVNNTQMQWSSSNEQVAKIGADGTVYGLKCGITDIMCTMPGGTIAKCTVKVISNLKLNTNMYSCYPDQKSGFAIMISGIKVSNSIVNWSSSNSDIVTISSNGVFNALKPGEVIIKAKNTVTDAYDECTVKVLEKDVVTLNTDMFSLYQGTKSGLAAYVNQNKANNLQMQWSSSNDQIVKVDANGIIYGLKSGIAVVSCTTQYGTTATCKITVLTSFRINTNYFELYPGTSSGFAALLDDVKLDNTLIQWTSSNEAIAKVDSNGRVYGISPGETTIIAKNITTNLLSVCSLKVLPFKTVKLNTNSFSFYRGDMSGLAVYVDGVKANNYQMQWKSNNENAVKVYADGRIEAISAGVAIISCTTLYGTTDECVIKVIGTYITGNSIATSQQMAAYYMSKVKAYPAQNYPSFYLNTDAPTIQKLCEIFLKEGEKEGVRGDIAFCQAMLETGFLQLFGSVPIQNLNFAGLGATGTADAPIAAFSTITVGIRAQIQHLKAYATPTTVEIKEVIVDPRFSLVKRGVAKYVEWLGQNENPEGRGWATGVNYGYNILRIYNELTKFY